MKKNILVILLLISTSSCGIYSLNGASIPPNAESISVSYFNNQANTINPNLSSTFTEKLKDIFIQQTNLNLIEENGDLAFSGFISKYEIKPISIQANETAAQNRLTISINVTYESKFEQNNNFTKMFSRYKDYNSSQNLTDIEESLVNAITNEIVEDIFNKSVVNW